MQKADFPDELRRLLDEAHDKGTGSRAVAFMTAEVLTEFIFSEAGAFADDAIDDICARMQQMVVEVMQ